jgi:hypothetical protein
MVVLRARILPHAGAGALAEPRDYFLRSTAIPATTRAKGQLARKRVGKGLLALRRLRGSPRQ